MIGAILYWYTIVCCYFYDTFCYFSVIRILVRLFCYLALLCCAFSVISTIVLYVPRVEIKKGWSCHVAWRGGPGPQFPTRPHTLSPVRGIFLNMTGFVLNMTVIVLNINRLVLNMNGFVQNMTEFLVNMTGYVSSCSFFFTSCSFFLVFFFNFFLLLLVSSGLYLFLPRFPPLFLLVSPHCCLFLPLI